MEVLSLFQDLTHLPEPEIKQRSRYAYMDGNVFRLNPLNGIFRYELKRPFDQMLGSAVNHIGSRLSLMKNPV